MAGGWNVVSDKAVNTPATLGASIVTNGDMELDANWANNGSPTTNERSNTQAHGGTYSRHFITGASFEGIQQTGMTTLAHGWYAVRLWGRSSQNLFVTAVRGDSGASPSATLTGAGAWAEKVLTFREVAGGVFAQLQLRSISAVSDIYVDDVSFRALTLAELLNIPQYPSADVTVSIAVTLPAGLQGGVALNWDSATNPLYGVIAYHDGTNACLDKCVNGAWTSVISATATYAAGHVVKAIKSGQSYTLLYGVAGSEAQIGNTATISDVGIISNTRHGLFATDALVGLDTWNIAVNSLDFQADTSFATTLFFNSGGGPMSIAYGDGTVESVASGAESYTYADGSLHTVRMTATLMDRLRYLDVQFGNNSGALPSFAICPQLETLHANNNELTGTLPSFAVNKLLKNLFIGSNLLSGTLPSFATCTALLGFSIADNDFSGTLPSFAACTLLTDFYAANNAFSGTLPTFAACTALETFSIAGTPFSGTLPSFATCTLLDYFHIGACNFSGQIPSFAACTLLTLWDGNKQNFSGSLPTFVACTLLENFWCNENSLSGTIPDFDACTALELWHGDSNAFTGYTAGAFATQPALAQLRLHNNLLTEAAVDAVLADLVTSLGLPGRVTCALTLNGTGNATPSAAGLTSKATLVSAWGAGNVLTN